MRSGVELRPARTAGWAAAFVVTGLIGRATIIDGGSLSLVWPAAGIAACWLATSPSGVRRYDVAVLGTVSFAVNAVTGASVPLGLLLAACNMGQAGLFALGLRRWEPELRCVGGTRSLELLRDLRSVAVLALLASLAASSVGNLGVLALTGHLNLTGFLVWWARNTTGVLLVGTTCFLLLDRRHGSDAPGEQRRRAWRSLAEYVVLYAVSAGLVALVFVPGASYPIAFLPIFLTVVVAIRLGPLGVSVHTLAFGSLMIWLTLHGHGPFARVADPYLRALIAQVFVATTVITGLVLAFYHRERDVALARARRAEHEAEERSGFLSAVLENVNDGVAVVRGDGAVLVRNFAGRRILQMDDSGPESVQSASTYGLLRSDGTELTDRELPYVAALAGETVPPEDFHVAGTTRTGNRIVSIGAKPLPGPSADGQTRAIVTLRDVTAERHERDHLAAFAGVVAHDLMNPLTVVRGWTGNLREAYGAGEVDAAEAAAMLAKIDVAAGTMAALIDDLLSFTVARDATLNPREVNVSAVAEQAAELRRAGEGRPRISVAPDLLARADPALVRQLLDNLIGNACKYVAPHVRPRVRVEGASVEGWLEVRVSDNGLGVPPEHRESIFDNFSRIEREGYAGTGIGLAICRQIVRRHGGTIRVAPNPEGGSVFVFTLPEVATVGAPVTEDATEGVTEGAAGHLAPRS